MPKVRMLSVTYQIQPSLNQRFSQYVKKYNLVKNAFVAQALTELLDREEARLKAEREAKQ